jgi:trehalose 6-phosphate phosphatase
MTRKLGTTPHLFSEWDQVASRIREKKRLAVFLDFDGTLVRIAPMPSGVRLDEETRKVLKKLAGNRNVTLTIISGRQRAELQRYIGIRNMKYLGLYGWEKTKNQRVPFPVREALARTLVSLLAELSSFPGVWIEPKRNSFSVHLLGASAKTQREMRQRVQKRVQPMRGTLQVMANLRDLEVAPLALGNKGVAVRKLLDDPALREALPIYFGDDFSDEPGFAATRNGISVLVGKRRATNAQFSLRGPAEVAAALSRMEEAIR